MNDRPIDAGRPVIGARFTAVRCLMVMCAVASVSLAVPLVAQSARTRARAPSISPRQPASSLLDAWIVTRYRGAQLLPDPVGSTTLPGANVPWSVVHPRVEAVRAGERSSTAAGAADSLIAVHFSPLRAVPVLAVDALAQLAGPSGTITPLAPRVVERRAFRAPRRPGSAIARPDSSWRYGWAYLATIPRTTGRAATRYRGWMLLAGP